MIIKERELDNMKNDKIEKLQQEILDDINTKEEKISNLKVYDNSINNYNLILKKFTQNDKKYDKKFQAGQDEFMRYLITTYYLDEDRFYDIVKNLNSDDLEYLKKYLNDHNDIENHDIIDDINVKVFEKKKKNK